MDFCDGWTSACRVQARLHGSQKDGLQHAMICRFAAIAGGQHAQHGIFKELEKCGILDYITCLGASEHMIYPSAWFRLIHQYPREFRLRLGADARRLREFWSEFLTRPVSKAWAARHPDLQGKCVEDLVNTVPFTSHADAGPYSKTQSCNIIQVSSLLSIGPELLTQFLCYSCLKDGTSKGSPHAAWEHLLADFVDLATCRLQRWCTY